MKNEFKTKRTFLASQEVIKENLNQKNIKNILNDVTVSTYEKAYFVEGIKKKYFNDFIEFQTHETDCGYVYNKKTKTFILHRWAGLGSNWVTLILFIIKLKGYYDIVPDNIFTGLHVYKSYNLYDDIFFINKEKIHDFKKIDSGRLLSFLSKNTATHCGIGNSKDDLDLELIQIVLESYFNFTPRVVARAEEIIKKYNLNLNSQDFILWRKADKISEVHEFPELNEALKMLKNKNAIGHTDDPDIFNEFEKNNINTLNEMGLDETKQGGHHQILWHPEKHDEKYHVLTMMAIVYLASKADNFIGYPGNLSWIVCAIKNFRNACFFKKQKELF